MTFQDKRNTGNDWDKVKDKRKLMHVKNDVEANVPNGVIKKTKPNPPRNN